MAYQSWSVTFGEQPSAAKWNILGSNDASFNDGTGIADGAVTAPKLDFGGSGEGIWWEEIGRTTLGSSGDTITVSSLPARKYLRVRAQLISSASINGVLRFNGDTGNNYAYRKSSNGGADTTGTSSSFIDVAPSAASDNRWIEIDIIALSTQNKQVLATATSVNGNASAAPGRVEIAGKWINSSDAVSSVSIVNTSTGDFAIGSEVVVLGHD